MCFLIFRATLHLQISHKCIKIRNLMITVSWIFCRDVAIPPKCLRRIVHVHHPRGPGIVSRSSFCHFTEVARIRKPKDIRGDKNTYESILFERILTRASYTRACIPGPAFHARRGPLKSVQNRRAKISISVDRHSALSSDTKFPTSFTFT